MSSVTAWPEALAGTAAVSVIERAIAQNRLSHSLLLQGEDMAALLDIAHAMADRLLNTPASGIRFSPVLHPDCFHLRPTGKIRNISANATRELIAKVQVSATVGHHKVAIIQEADRMNATAANVFLKTLEEPPKNTTVLLLTTRPYALLPTIRSRVQLFRFSSNVGPLQAAGWSEWMADYQGWLSRLISGTTIKQSAADHLFSLYGLLARFSFILDQATAAAWEQQKTSLAADLEDDEKVAIEAGLSNGLRARLFADTERATRSFALPYLERGDTGVRRPFAATIDALEHSFGLLSLNLNESTALEDFLLATLRAWTRR